ncbi:MAG: amino acid adenylation domain-containing protein [Bacteroidales bacterium]|nr:amino acid adenylation domain-containing protein [Bacteroidales bacterium]
MAHNNNKLTYKQLDEQSDALAATLLRKGLQPEEAVALYCHKSLALITGMLAILKAGGAYLPIEPDTPPERVNFMLNDASCCFMFTNQQIDNRPVKCKNILLLDHMEPASGKVEINQGIQANSLAYIMYTSGTTGTPKACLIEHKSVIRLVCQTNYINLASTDKILLTGAIAFDASTFEIWGALLNGGTLYLADKETILHAARMEEALKKHEITTLWLTSPLFTQLAEINPGMFSGLKTLLVGGDVLSATHVNKVRETSPGLTVINGYGPTENTTFSTCHVIEKNYEHNIPIGKPVSNSTAYIFDKHMHETPIGATGDLYVGGDGLARGYLNHEDLNRQKFIRHPRKPHERLYKTGDRASWLPDGTIAFHGRADNQLKINGFRVEPQEIEACINQVDGVIDSVVKPLTNNGSVQLYAFVNTKKGISISKKDIAHRLQQQLPAYMQPAGYKLMHGFPKTANGKTDRNALAAENILLQAAPQKKTEPTYELEDEVRSIFIAVLKHDQFTLNDRFFDIGGSSLLLLSVISKIEKQYSITIKVRDFYARFNTVKEIATLIFEHQNPLPYKEKVRHKQEVKFDHLYCLQPEGSLPPIFSIYSERGLSKRKLLGNSHPIYAFVWPGSDGKNFEMNTVEEIANDYLRQVKQINPEGPFYLIGFSFGGLVAFAMATKLQQEGFKVPLLALLDCKHPKQNEGKMQKYRHLAKNHGFANMLFDRVFRGAPRLITRKTEELLVKLLVKHHIKLGGRLRKRMILMNSANIYYTFKPGIYDGTLLLFKVRDNAIADELLGWAPHAGQVKSIMLEGVHLDAIDLPKNKETLDREIYSHLHQ